MFAVSQSMMQPPQSALGVDSSAISGVILALEVQQMFAKLVLQIDLIWSSAKLNQEGVNTASQAGSALDRALSNLDATLRKFNAFPHSSRALVALSALYTAVDFSFSSPSSITPTVSHSASTLPNIIRNMTESARNIVSVWVFFVCRHNLVVVIHYWVFDSAYDHKVRHS